MVRTKGGAADEASPQERAKRVECARTAHMQLALKSVAAACGVRSKLICPNCGALESSRRGDVSLVPGPHAALAPAWH
jgi:hypothetical protein